MRIEACETCKRYVSRSTSLDARPLPEVDDLVSLAMDLWAMEEGWTRLEHGGRESDGMALVPRARVLGGGQVGLPLACDDARRP